MPTRKSKVATLLALLLATMPLGSCSWWFFSDTPTVDRDRPVALIETTGGVEYGVTTELGILTLGRSAGTGPCRVHYFLGPTPIIEDGELLPLGDLFTEAWIGLKTQHITIHDLPIDETTPLVAMWTEDGRSTRTVEVSLASQELAKGDLLADPGQALPPGAAILYDYEGDYRFIGLVSGRASLRTGTSNSTFYTFAGTDRIRELLATPDTYPRDTRVEFRPDGIAVRRPIK